MNLQKSYQQTYRVQIVKCLASWIDATDAQNDEGREFLVKIIGQTPVLQRSGSGTACASAHASFTI